MTQAFVKRRLNGKYYIDGLAAGTSAQTTLELTPDEARELYVKLGEALGILAKPEGSFMCAECGEGKVAKPGRICRTCLTENP